MSRIRVTYDFGTDTWDTKEYKIKETVFDNTNEKLWSDVEISFRKNGSQHIDFNDLSFGYKFKHKDQVFMEDSWPQDERKYHCTDQDVMQHVRYNDFLAGESYDLYFWVKEDGITKDYTYKLKVPGYKLR